ncbi:MAG: SDR family oxidoreductase [Oligoflexia bacterium]|nr:SDR family oxidoreductase [Oligoflexia bacterium]
MKIAVFGATSAIAQAACRIWAGRGAEFLLAGRSADRLEAVKGDLTVHGAQTVVVCCCDLSDTSRHAEIIEQGERAIGPFDLVLIAYGTLPDQALAETDFLQAQNAINTNFLSVVSLLTELAKRMETRHSGTLAVISSVAGDRGRQSNYVYGAAKGGLSIYLAGLRNRLFHKGVKVLTIKPGFVDTPMTAAIKKGPLFVKPAVLGAGIVRAVDRGSDVAYLPWFWMPIMWIIRSIPEGVFKRMRL